MNDLLSEIRQCSICSGLPLGPRPIVSVDASSRILIIGQAPGTKVHASGIPWDDPSGKLLRKWLGIDDQTFYDPTMTGIMPMGFCYPGKGKSGDLPPRPECAPKWHGLLLKEMKQVQLTLLIGKYAQEKYLEGGVQKNLTETVKNYEAYLPKYLPLPHPSPRNRFWMAKNPWFNDAVIPVLQERVRQILGGI